MSDLNVFAGYPQDSDPKPVLDSNLINTLSKGRLFAGESLGSSKLTESASSESKEVITYDAAPVFESSDQSSSSSSVEGVTAPLTKIPEFEPITVQNVLQHLPGGFIEILKEIRNLSSDASSKELASECRSVIFKFSECYDSQSFRDLVNHLDSTSFYTDPASTHFHGSYTGGLALHSLKVVRRLFTLVPQLLPESYFESFRSPLFGFMLMVAALGHDFAKIGMYTTDYRNTKDSSGQWIKVPYYKVRDDFVSLGHGIDSVMYLQRFFPGQSLPVPLQYAIRYHMGAWGLAESDTRDLRQAMSVYPEILLLQTADQLAANLDNA